LQCLRHDHALAGRQSVGFYHNGGTLRAQVFKCRFQLCEVAIGTGGDIVTREKVLGECLGAFQLSGACAGSEASQAALLKVIYHPFNQRCLGADDGEAYVFIFCENTQAIKIHRVDGNIADTGFCCGTGITGRNKNGVYLRRLRNLPGQCMLAPATADYQYIHLFNA